MNSEKYSVIQKLDSIISRCWKTGFFLKWVKIQKTWFSNRTELHPIGTGMFDVFWMNLYLNDE